MTYQDAPAAEPFSLEDSAAPVSEGLVADFAAMRQTLRFFAVASALLAPIAFVASFFLLGIDKFYAVSLFAFGALLVWSYAMFNRYASTIAHLSEQADLSALEGVVRAQRQYWRPHALIGLFNVAFGIAVYFVEAG